MERHLEDPDSGGGRRGAISPQNIGLMFSVILALTVISVAFWWLGLRSLLKRSIG